MLMAVALLVSATGSLSYYYGTQKGFEKSQAISAKQDVGSISTIMPKSTDLPQSLHQLPSQPQPKPLYKEPYVAVYGRDNCGQTQNMLVELKKTNVNLHYFIIDEDANAVAIKERLEDAGMNSENIQTPVVDVNGYLSLSPTVSEVLPRYFERT